MADEKLATLSPSERFTNMVMREFSSNGGGLGTNQLTGVQKRLCQNYFIEVDKCLRKAEMDRLKKHESKRDAVAVTWNNVNMVQLATDVVSISRVGLDPALNNHVFMIPYKNNNTGKYDINFTVGYKGKELIATKFGLDTPDDIVIELVYSTDKFEVIKKGIDNRVEGYRLTITDNFNRGELVGGFYYFNYFDKPEKNFIRVMSKAQIEKRRPTFASPDFWGGERDEYVNGQKTGRKVKVEGWYDEMCYKTLHRTAYGSIIIDSQKIDDNYIRVLQLEEKTEEDGSYQVVEDANKPILSIEAEPHPEVHEPAPETAPVPEPIPVAEPVEKPTRKAKAQETALEF